MEDRLQKFAALSLHMVSLLHKILCNDISRQIMIQVGEIQTLFFRLKPGLHEPRLQVERSVKLVSSIVVERRRCALQVSSVARLENKET